MSKRQVLTSVFVTLALVLVVGGLTAHAHEHGASEDGCLCAHSSCPEPNCVALTLDAPRPSTDRAVFPQVAPVAPPVDAPIVRRGPPISAV